jgi:type II secretory pathway pseudopilin PulG
MACLTVGVSIPAGWLACGSRPARRALLGLIVVAAVLLPTAGGVTGAYGWRREFTRNRRAADAVVAALEQYRAAHGAYPERLADLGTPVETAFRQGSRIDPLVYERTPNEGFVLDYQYGW